MKRTQEVVIRVSYFSRNESTARRGKGLYPTLLLLGIHQRRRRQIRSAAMAENDNTQVIGSGTSVAETDST